MTVATPEYSTLPSSIVIRYEALRMAALGEALPPESRNGLMLFLRRGMWRWGRTLATVSPTQEPIPTPSITRTAACCERIAVIRVLAAMAMNVHNRRTS
jgi:hypothetical protein